MEKQKHLPSRMCIACRKIRPKQELVRIIKLRDNGYRADVSGKQQGGRGAYVCPDAACVEKAKKIFGKAMHCRMDDALYEDLMKVANEYTEK
ncbi:MAG: YlxR family protein, partial [Christensenella sp.]|uniref:YlxR family protein n=1 Tax=Christensenella sp. TaxID=1935934 RepID=UPI002B217111